SMFLEMDVNDDSYCNIAPAADDLWYSKLLIRNGNQIVVVPDVLAELNFIRHGDGLYEYNISRKTSLLNRVRRKISSRVIGYFGGSVCNNDIAYHRIESHFSNKF